MNHLTQVLSFANQWLCSVLSFDDHNQQKIGWFFPFAVLKLFGTLEKKKKKKKTCIGCTDKKNLKCRVWKEGKFWKNRGKKQKTN